MAILLAFYPVEIYLAIGMLWSLFLYEKGDNDIAVNLFCLFMWPLSVFWFLQGFIEGLKEHKENHKNEA